ncbi:MAG: DUF359 domain-containing protein [Candidatus Bathyarchaeia archaeon]
MLTPELRDELKKPLGLLIRGKVGEVEEVINKIIEDTKPTKIITVGDVISKSLLKRGLRVDVLIIDNKSMRRPIEPINYGIGKILHLSNPAGTINGESWHVIREAVNSNGSVQVLVDGEEDLLAIVAVLLAPENSLVMYGQPGEGVVIINVNRESKEKMHKIINRMEYKRDMPEKGNLSSSGG